jgi:ubiquinone/menaquinone biosynthesis C-methylase UbiE
MAGNTKRQVREFYDKVGWSQISEGLYQNARFEDLRPVSREYIHKCHLRVKRYIAPTGDFLLDAGSGPVQYPEYLTYSEGYRFRVCADISFIALVEARKIVGEHGLYVVADVSNLPFKPETFDGIVSLHTIHHLPVSEQRGAYLELVRTLKTGKSAVVVNGWHDPALMKIAEPFIQLGRRLTGRKKKKGWEDNPALTFVERMTPRWLKHELNDLDYRIYAWRSMSTRVLRWFIRPKLGGRHVLRIVFWLEERFPRFFGENGQYPLIMIRKS